MKKLLKVFALAAVLVLAFGAVTAMAADDIEVYINGENIQFDVPPQAINSRTMIPFRYVANAFGAEVDFIENEDGQFVTAVLDGKELLLKLGDPVALFSEGGISKEIEFDVAPVAVSNRTLVPVRLVAEAFGCNVGWNGDDYDVIIIDPKPITAAFKEASPVLYNDVFNFDLTKIKGTYDADLTISTGDEEVIIPMSLKATDDAVDISISVSGIEFEFIATKDTIYAKDSTSTGNKWVASALDEGLANYEITDFNLELTADMIISALCKTYVEEYVVTKDTYSQLISVLDIFVASAEDDSLVIEESKTGKSIEYSAIFPLDTSVAGIKISKETANDVSDAFSLVISAADLEDTNNTVSFALNITRDKKVKTTKITLPKDSEIIK